MRCRIAPCMSVLAGVVAALAPAGPLRAEEGSDRAAYNNHCRQCHSTRPGDNRLGPSMHGMFGAEAGAVKDFKGYSGSLAGFTWDQTTLDRFIADPVAFATNTNMITPPVGDPGERRKIIAFLKSISELSSPSPPDRK